MGWNPRTAGRERERALYLLRRWTTRIIIATVGLAGGLIFVAASSIPGRGASGPLAAVGSALSSASSSLGGEEGSVGASVPQPPAGGISQPSGGSPVTVSGGS